jgi:hypothetical protein
MAQVFVARPGRKYGTPRDWLTGRPPKRDPDIFSCLFLYTLPQIALKLISSTYSCTENVLLSNNPMKPGMWTRRDCMSNRTVLHVMMTVHKILNIPN